MTKVSPCSPAAPLLFVDTLDRPEYTYTHEVRIQTVGNIIKYLHVPYLRKQYTKSVCIYRRYLIFERGKIMDSRRRRRRWSPSSHFQPCGKKNTCPSAALIERGDTLLTFYSYPSFSFCLVFVSYVRVFFFLDSLPAISYVDEFLFFVFLMDDSAEARAR